MRCMYSVAQLPSLITKGGGGREGALHQDTNALYDAGNLKPSDMSDRVMSPYR